MLASCGLITGAVEHMHSQSTDANIIHTNGSIPVRQQDASHTTYRARPQEIHSGDLKGLAKCEWHARRALIPGRCAAPAYGSPGPL